MRVKLEDVCDKGTSSLKQADIMNKAGNYPIYGASGYIGNVDFYHQEKPYVAIVKDGAGIGRTALYQGKSSLIGTMQYLLPKNNILPKYLYYVVTHMHLEKYFTGATIPHIYFRDYKNEEFNLHSPKEQSAIVTHLDKISALIEKRKTQLTKLDQLVKARFVEMFWDYNYPKVLFENICVFLRNGANIKQTKGAGGYPITRIETLSNDMFNIDRLGYADITDLEKYQNYVLHNGDILISHINSIAYLGRAVQYRNQLDSPVIHGMNLLCARIKDCYNPTYIEWFFKTSIAKEYISSITKKAVNQASITTSDLKKMKVLNPPLELQTQFADFVQQVDKSKQSIQKSLDELETLKKALMQQYFG